MTVRQLLQNATLDEVLEWIAFLELEPPDEQAWYRTAVIASTIVNVGRIQAMGRVPSRSTIKDFMPKKNPKPAPKQTSNTMRAMLQALTQGSRK